MLKDEINYVFARDMNTDLKEYAGRYSARVKYDDFHQIYNISTDINNVDNVWWGDGIVADVIKGQEIPWKDWYVIEMDVKAPLDCQFIVDINNRAIDTDDWNGNDNNSDGSKTKWNLEKNSWKRIYIYYRNASKKNVKKASIRNYTHFGIKYPKEKGNQIFQIKNFKSYVTPYLPQHVH